MQHQDLSTAGNYGNVENKHGELLTGETPFHRLKKFSVLIILMNTVTIPTFGALQVEI